MCVCGGGGGGGDFTPPPPPPPHIECLYEAGHLHTIYHNDLYAEHFAENKFHNDDSIYLEVSILLSQAG